MKTMQVAVFEGGGPAPLTTPPPAILACDDDPHALAILAAFARKNDFVVETSSEPEELGAGDQKPTGRRDFGCHDAAHIWV